MNSFTPFYFEVALQLNEKIRYGDTYSISRNNTKSIKEVNYKELEKAVFSSTLQNQIILEIEDHLPKKKREELSSKLFNKLKEHKIPFSTIFSGGKSYHFHIFIKPDTFKKLKEFFNLNEGRISINGERINFRYLLVKFLGKIINFEGLLEILDTSFLQKSHMFPFPNKNRRDKPKPTKLIYHDIGFWDFHVEQFIEYINRIKKEKQKDKEYIYLYSLKLSKPSSPKLMVLRKSFEKIAQKGVEKGKRDITSFTFYLKLRSIGVSKEEAKTFLKSLLENSEPKGVWDNEKQSILNKVDKYWEGYFGRNIKTKAHPYKVADKLEEKISVDKEAVIEGVKEYIKNVRKFNPYIEEIQTLDELKEFIVFRVNGKEVKISFRTKEGELNMKKALINLNKELFFVTGNLEYLKANELLKTFGKEDTYLFEKVFMEIYSKLEKERYTLIGTFVKRILSVVEEELKKRGVFKNVLGEEDIKEITSINLSENIDAFCSEFKIKPIKFINTLAPHYFTRSKNGFITANENLARLILKEYEKQEQVLQEIKEENQENGGVFSADNLYIPGGED